MEKAFVPVDGMCYTAVCRRVNNGMGGVEGTLFVLPSCLNFFVFTCFFCFVFVLFCFSVTIGAMGQRCFFFSFSAGVSGMKVTIDTMECGFSWDGARRGGEEGRRCWDEIC